MQKGLAWQLGANPLLLLLSFPQNRRLVASTHHRLPDVYMMLSKQHLVRGFELSSPEYRGMWCS